MRAAAINALRSGIRKLASWTAIFRAGIGWKTRRETECREADVQTLLIVSVGAAAPIGRVCQLRRRAMPRHLEPLTFTLCRAAKTPKLKVVRSPCISLSRRFRRLGSHAHRR